MKVYFKAWLTVLVLALGVLVMITLASQPARAAGPWYVTPGGDDSNDCLSPTTACATINGALNKPGFVAGDTILVATGTYTSTGSEVVLLDEDVTLSGGWDVTFTTQSGASTIDGQGARRGITVDGGWAAIIEWFSIQGGYNWWAGGGILNRGTLILNNSTVCGNTAGDHGGGIANSNGTLIMNNSTVTGKTSLWAGGGISSYGTLILNNSTVSDNTAIYHGGGIYRYGHIATLQNTIVAENTAGSNGPDCWEPDSGFIHSAGYNLIGDISDCGFNPGSGDLTNVDPLLGLLEGSPGYHPLLRGSPAINAGNPAGCTDHLGNPLTTDQRGFPRLGRCDTGAYEVFPFEFSTKGVNKSTALPGDPLTYTIALDNGETVNITNVRVTDTLPISITYISNSLTATEGSYGYINRVITWTGSVNASEVVTIAFGATVSQAVPLGTSITNSAVISGGGEMITRTATVAVEPQRVYLPVVLKNW
jgi:uncharacterized repeat protein (TIGR01451 family)